MTPQSQQSGRLDTYGDIRADRPPTSDQRIMSMLPGARAVTRRSDGGKLARYTWQSYAVRDAGWRDISQRNWGQQTATDQGAARRSDRQRPIRCNAVRPQGLRLRMKKLKAKAEMPAATSISGAKVGSARSRGCVSAAALGQVEGRHPLGVIGGSASKGLLSFGKSSSEANDRLCGATNSLRCRWELLRTRPVGQPCKDGPGVTHRVLGSDEYDEYRASWMGSAGQGRCLMLLRRFQPPPC